MTQSTPIIGSGNSGIEYRNKDNDGKQALLNHHKGSTSPSYAEAGAIWLDDSTTPWMLKIHDGSDWIGIFAINASANTVEAWHGGAPLRILNHVSDTGASINTFAVAPAPPATAYTAGMVVTLKPGHAQTGAATLNINSLGTKNIKTQEGVDPPSGAMVTSGVYVLVYDGTNFILTNPALTSVGNAVAVTLKDANFTLQDDGDTTKQAKFELSGITAGQTRTFTLPDASQTVVGATATQTLQNKTLDDTNTATFKDDNFTLEDGTTTSKKAKFELSGISASTTRTFTLPDRSDTLAGLADLSGVVKSVKRQVFTSSGTYTPSTGMVFVLAQTQGGGGGGGGVISNGSQAAGGGEGAYAELLLTAADVGASKTVTVGAGGSAGANTGGTGGNGGQSSLGSLVTAPGGQGGAGNTATTGSSSVAGGTGGSAGTGQIATAGAQGENGNYGSGNAYGTCGGGAHSRFGRGGGQANGTGGNGIGNAGTGYGAGGSGAFSGTTATGAHIGGVGAAGVIILTEYCTQ